MNVRMIRYWALAGVLMGLLGSLALPAQQPKSHFGREEWNDYQAAKDAPTPSEKVAAYEAFLAKYPESVLRVYILPEHFLVLYRSQQRAASLGVLDDFLELDPELFRLANSAVTEGQIKEAFYLHRKYYVGVAREMLSTNQKFDPSQAKAVVQQARAGLNTMEEWRQVHAARGTDAAVVNNALADDELMYHQVLATLIWRQKDYDSALPELTYLITKLPENPNLTLQLGYSYLNKGQPDPLKSIWYLARAVALGHPQAESARRTVLRQIVRYTGVAPSCMQGEIDAVYLQAAAQLHPPAGWGFVSSERIDAARQGITQVGLFDELDGEGESAHVAWLAACGVPFGLSEDGDPTYEAVLLSFEETELEAAEAESAEGGAAPGEGTAGDEGSAEGAAASETRKAVILRVAATQAAIDTRTANLEIVVEGFTNFAKLREETNQTIKIGGTIASFSQGPFVLRLEEGKVEFLVPVFDQQ